MTDIERALESFRRDSILRRMNPDNPICPGCGRRDNGLEYPVNLLTGVMQLCCAECADDESAGMNLEEYRNDLEANYQPLTHHSVSSHYRGILLPPDFYDAIEIVN